MRATLPADDDASPIAPWRRLTARILLVIFGSGCVLPGGAHAAPMADPGGPIAFRPGIGQTSTGVPAVDITRPNAAGTSYNRYQRFDVEQEGVVLNNSARAGTTLLGGSVAANPNLAGGAGASVIVNEVVAPAAVSRLAGAIEVFGTPATVIVANPNGVTCAGCGTVNSPRFMLSTGTPVWLDAAGRAGGFEGASGVGFDVLGGQLRIEGRGLEGTVGKVDLVAAGIHLDGPVRAHYLNPELAGITVLAGAGRIVDKAGQFENLNPGQAAALPPGSFAIDGTAFGAMSSSQIRIVSTDQGVGVRMAGPLLADSLGLVVRSGGDLSVGELLARQSITLDAAGNLNMQGAAASGGELTVRAGGRATVSGASSATGTASLEAGDTVDILAPLSSGGRTTVRADQVRLAAGISASETQIDARSLVLGSGERDVQIRGDLNLAVTGDLVTPGAVAVSGNTRLAASSSVGLGGDVTVGGDLLVDAATDIRAAGRLSAGGLVRLRAGQGLDIVGGVSAGALDLVAGRAVLGGDLMVAGDGSIVAGSLVLPSRVEADGSLRIDTAGDLLSSGRVVASGDLNLGAGGRVALAESGAGGRADLVARGGSLSIGAPFVAGRTVSLAGRDGVLANVVQSGGDLGIVSSAGAVVTGALVAPGAVALNAALGLTVGGPLAGGGDVRLVSGSALQLAGDVSAGAGLSLGAASIRARGVLAGGPMQIEAGQLEAETLAAGGALELHALTGASVSAGVLANGPVRIVVSDGALALGGPLLSNGALTVTTRSDIGVLGEVGSGAATSLVSQQGRIAVQGGASSAAGITLDAFRQLEVGGDMAARGPIVLHSGVAGVNVAGSLASAGSLSADAPGDIRFGGDTWVGTELAVATTAGALAFARTLEVGGAARLAAARGIDFGGDSRFFGALSVGSAGGPIVNRGHLYSSADFIVDTLGDFISEGRIDSLAAVSIRGAQLSFNTQQAGGVFANGGISLAARDVGRLGRSGALASSAAIALEGPRFETAGEVLSAGGPLSFTGNTLVNAGLAAAQTVVVNGRLENEAGGQVSAASVEVRGTTLNRGEIGGGTVVLADAVSNAGTIVGDRVAVGGDLLNEGKLGGGDFSFTGSKLVNAGQLAARAVGVTAVSMDNRGQLQGERVDLQLAGALGNSGVIESAGTMTVVADALGNSGTVHAGSGGSIRVTQGVVNDGGRLSAVEGLGIVSGASLSNRGGRILAGGDLAVQLAGDLIGAGLAAANRDLQVKAGGGLELAEGGAGRDGTLSAEGGRLRIGSPFAAGGNLSVAGRDGVVTEALSAGGALAVGSVRGDVATGSLMAAGPVSLVAAGAGQVFGAVVSDGAVNLNVGSRLGVDGVLASGGDAALSAGGVRVGGPVLVLGALVADAGPAGLTLSAEARAGAGVLLKGQQVSASGVLTGGRLAIQTGAGGLDNRGSLVGNAGVEVNSLGAVAQQGVVASQGNVSLTGLPGLSLLSDVEAGGNLALGSAGQIIAGGAWRSAGALDVRAGQSIDQARDVLAGGAASLTAEAGSLKLRGRVLANGALGLKAGGEIEAGALGGGLEKGEAVSVEAGGNVVLADLQAGGNYLARAGGDYRVNGASVVVGNLDLGAARDVVHGTAVSVGGNALVQAGARLAQGETRILGTGTLISGGAQAYAGNLSAGDALALRAGAGVAVAGALLTPGALSVEGGAGEVSVAGALSAGARLQVDADSAVTVGGELLALGAAQLRSRQDSIRLNGAVTALEALGLEAAGDVRLGGDLTAMGALDARSALGSVVFERGLGVAGPASFSVGQDLVFSGDALFYGPLSATRVGRTLDSRTRLQVGGDLSLDITGDFVSEGLLQSTGGVRILARNITANLSRAGGIVANGDIELVARDQGQLGAQGSMSSSGGSILLSASRFINAGDVLPGGAGFAFSGGSLRNAGRIAADTVRVAGALDNVGAVYGETVSISGHAGNLGTIAGGTLSFNGGLGNGGVIAGRSVSASATVSNSGEISGDSVSLSGGAVANSGLVSATRVSIHAAELANQGTLSAGTLDVRTFGSFINGGSVQVGGNADIVADGGFVNQLVEVSRCVTPAVCNPRPGLPPPPPPDPEKDFRFVQSPAVLAVGGQLTLSGGRVENQGVIQAKGINLALGAAALVNVRSENDVLTDTNFGAGTPTTNTGLILAAEDISIAAGSLLNRGGRIAAGGGLDARVSGTLSSVAGVRAGLSPLLSGRDVTLSGAELQTDGLVHATRDLSLLAPTGSLINRGTLLADNSLAVLAGTTVSNADKAALLGTRSVSLKGAHGIFNAGLIYGNGEAAERVFIDAGDGSFTNVATGSVLAGASLDIKAAAYANGGMVASRGDARLDAPSFVFRPASSPLVAFGTLRLDVAGVVVDVGETWVSPAMNTFWRGVLVNTGRVLLGGNAAGSVDNLATGGRTLAGDPDESGGAYLLLGLPTLNGAYVDSHTDVATRAQFVVNGLFQGSLRNVASDAKAAGSYAYSAGSIAQTIRWTNAQGETEETAALSLARLDATGGSTVITLDSPDAGTIVAGNLGITGVNLNLGAGVDPTAAQQALAASRLNRVTAGKLPGAQSVVSGPGGAVGTGGVVQPASVQGVGSTPGLAATPERAGQTLLAGVTAAPVQGSGVVQVGASPVAGSTAGAVSPVAPDLADPGQPASGNGTRAVPQALVDPAALPVAGSSADPSIKTPAVPATPGGNLPADEAARYGLAFPDWGSFTAVPGTLRADNVDLLLSGRFTNRGVFEVADQLLIQAEGGIDNFGASIRAGGALGLFGASLDNRNGSIQAGSLTLALVGALDNTRGRILIDKDATFAVGGDLINDSGRIEAGSLTLDVGGNLYNRTLYAVDQKGTTTTRHAEFDSVFGTTVTTRSDSTVAQSADLRAGIVARTGDLVLNVGKDLVVTGADLKAAGALTGRVGGNIKVEALSLENSRTRVDTVSNERSYTLNNGETETTGLTASGRTVTTRIDSEIRHQTSVLEAGGKLDLESAGSTLIVGAQVKSGADTRIIAGGHLVLGAVVDSTHVEQRVTTQVEGAAILPGLPTAGGERLALQHAETAIGGQMDAGGGTTLQAGGSLILSGQHLRSGGDTRLAGNSLALDGISLENRSEARNAGSTVVALDARSLHRGSAIQSGGSLDVTATGVPEDSASTAGSIRGRGVQLEARRALTLAAAGDITLEAGRNTEDYVSRNHSGTAIVERSRDESARNLLSGEAISVAGRNITLEAASLSSPGKVSIVARDALSLAAATDTTSDHTLSVTKTGSWLSKKTTTVEHSEQSLRAATTRIDAGDILLQSGADLDLYGARLNAGGEVRLAAGGELHAYAVQDVLSVMDRKKVVRAPGIGALLLGEDPTFRRRKTETRDSSTTDEAQVTQLQSVGELTTQSGGDTLLQASRIAAARTTIAVGVGDKAEADATLILEGAKNRLDTSHTISKKSFVWQNQSGQGESTETLQVVNIQGPVTIQAQKIVAQLPEGDFKTQLAKQAAQPGQAWMLQLADRPGVDWKAVALAHDKWDYQQEGLTAEAALMIAIAVAIVSGGTGASLVGATSTMGIAVANAGFIALTSQAAITLINNKGNLGKTLSDLGREETLRSVATAMVTAGALSALAGSISVPNADGSFTPLANVSGSSDLVAQIGKNVINNTASAIIDTAINGGDLGDKLGRAITTGVIDAAGASAANSVGDLSGFSNRMGHLVVGCALGAAKGGDCGAGAIGGLAGELAAEWYGGNREPVSATQASRTVDVARLFGALAATLVGGDAQTGAGAAGNAAQNNFLNHFQIKQLNEQLAQCKGQIGCINQAISDARELDKRQHDLIAQTETAQGSRALVEGIQRPGATIDTSLCAGVSACVKYAEELPLINMRDYIYGVQDRIGELAQIKRILAFETQIRQADPALSDEEVTRRAAARAGVYDAGRLGQLLGAAGKAVSASSASLREGAVGVGAGAVISTTANSYGVTFFGNDILPFYGVSKTTVGNPNGAVSFFMLLEDSIVVRNAHDAAVYTGMAPSSLKAYRNGGDIYGFSFPLDGLSVRKPSALDADGWPHYLEGGNTAVKLEGVNAGYMVNPVRELVTPGDSLLPKGSVLFELGPSGEWIPLRRW